MKTEGRREQRQPLVSCIIIFLNEEKFLAEAVESVVGQTYDNWELLLVDDGSTDRSETIARSYAERFPAKIRYLTHERRGNRGMSASRNLGLRHARGELLAFLDGDDWWYPDKLEQQVILFEQHPQAVMVCGATLYWHSWDASSKSRDEVRQVGQLVAGQNAGATLVQADRLYATGELMHWLYPLGKGLTPSSSGNMYRRDAALAVGGYEEEFRGMFEDQAFRAKIYLQGPIFISTKVFDRYRQHAQSCYQVSKATGRSDPAREQFLRWLARYLDQVGRQRLSTRLRVRRKLLRYDYPLMSRIASVALRGLRRG